MIEHKQGYSDNSLPSTLSQEEKTIYRAIACRIAVNEVVLNEGLAIPQVCEEIDSKPKPDVPMLLFVSDGKENGGESWISFIIKGLEKPQGVAVFCLYPGDLGRSGRGFIFPCISG